MTPSNEDLERQFERLLRDPLTRRLILKRGAAGAMSASALAYLAACGTDEPAAAAAATPSDEKPIAKGKIASSLYFANWPLYIDEKHSALKSFEQKYGTKIKYVEEINDNDQFFGKVRQQYAQGESGGRDIQVVTDWMADAHDAARLRAEVRQVRDAERDDEHHRPAGVAAVRPERASSRCHGSRG